MSEGDSVDPIILGAATRAGEIGMKAADSAAKETGGLLSRLLGPSADILGQDWAERLRQKNMTRLLKKTEALAEGGRDSGWAQPRVANAVFEAAQYANDEIVTDYLSGVLASSRKVDGGTDDALPWSSLVSRLSALQLRIHYVFYRNLRQIVRVTDERSRIFDFEDVQITMSRPEFVQAVGLGPDDYDYGRFADALQGLKQEELIQGFAWGEPEFFTERHGKRYAWPKLRGVPQKTRVLEPPFNDLLMISFTPFGVQFFLWGLGLGMADDSAYLNPDLDLSLNDPDALVDPRPLSNIGFSEDYWVEHEVPDEADPAIDPVPKP